MENEHFYIIVYRFGDCNKIDMTSFDGELNLATITYQRERFCSNAEKVWAVELTEQEFDQVISKYPPCEDLAQNIKNQNHIYDEWFVPRYVAARGLGKELRWNFTWEHEHLYQRTKQIMSGMGFC
jgi:hypothetical protein